MRGARELRSGALVSLVGLAAGGGVACGAAPPAIVTTTTAAEPAASEPAPPAAPETEQWIVPQHAVRTFSATAWDAETQSHVVISSSGHLVTIDGATGLVRTVERFARRAEPVTLVVGGGHGTLSYETSEGELLFATLDLVTGHAVVTGSLDPEDEPEEAAPEEAAPEEAADSPADAPPLPTETTTGGESAVHATWLRPDAEGIVVGQRGASVVITREGVRVIDCIDGEQELTWSPVEPGVALQGEDGHCDLRTGQGTLAAREDESGYGYEEESTGDDEDEAEEAPPADEVICAEADPHVCITFPVRGPARLRAGEGARPRTLRGLDDASVQFSPSARFLIAADRTSVRILEVATGRDRLRFPSSRVVDWSADERWVVTTAEGHTSVRALDDPARVYEVPHALRAESVVFEPGGESALTCADDGIARLSLVDGAEARLASTPCATIRVFGTHAVVRGRTESRYHVVDLERGESLIDFGGDVRPPPAGSSFFHACEGHDLTVVDVGAGTRRVIADGCRLGTTSEDGLFSVRPRDLETIALRRSDGAELDLHVIWVDGAPRVYAVAEDLALWVPSTDHLGEVNLVTRVGDRVTVEPASAPAPQRQLYRPTLLADFLDGRPLPHAAARP